MNATPSVGPLGRRLGPRASAGGNCARVKALQVLCDSFRKAQNSGIYVSTDTLRFGYDRSFRRTRTGLRRLSLKQLSRVVFTTTPVLSKTLSKVNGMTASFVSQERWSKATHAAFQGFSSEHSTDPAVSSSCAPIVPTCGTMSTARLEI